MNSQQIMAQIDADRLAGRSVNDIKATWAFAVCAAQLRKFPDTTVVLSLTAIFGLIDDVFTAAAL